MISSAPNSTYTNEIQSGQITVLIKAKHKIMAPIYLAFSMEIYCKVSDQQTAPKKTNLQEKAPVARLNEDD